MKKYRCGCGAITGKQCDWEGELGEMVIVEYMPEWLRSSHEAAGNHGVYPLNGAERIAVSEECADALADGKWCRIVEHVDAGKMDRL